MVDMAIYWPVVLSIGLGTYLLRLSFILVLSEVKLSQAFMGALRFIPASVLAAIIAPSLFLSNSEASAGPGFERPLAGLIAIAVAWKTGNVLATIAVGLVALWLIQWCVA